MKSKRLCAAYRKAIKAATATARTRREPIKVVASIRADVPDATNAEILQVIQSHAFARWVLQQRDAGRPGWMHLSMAHFLESRRFLRR